jgi:hypothetical protein
MYGNSPVTGANCDSFKKSCHWTQKLLKRDPTAAVPSKQDIIKEIEDQYAEATKTVFQLVPMAADSDSVITSMEFLGRTHKDWTPMEQEARWNNMYRTHIMMAWRKVQEFWSRAIFTIEKAMTRLRICDNNLSGLLANLSPAQFKVSSPSYSWSLPNHYLVALFVLDDRC